MAEAGLLELTCTVQKYHWGKRGHSSLVAQLALKGNHLASIEESTTYAELWMGTHPSCPSKIRGMDRTLASYITEHPECLGGSVRAIFGSQLPFLFKVLSVGAPLSIQAHPTKVLAKKLHEAYPDLYPDSNHKPEIAIALTEFEAFCNFRPLREISHLLKGLPELRELLGKLAEQHLTSKEELQAWFRAVITAPPEVFLPLLKKLADRLGKNEEAAGLPSELANVFLRVYGTYPNDIGCFVIFFLNYVKLQPGEALFLAANEPHAYIFGDCVECMACSDNVVRAGLTPKHKDVGTLCSMLSYNSVPLSQVRFPAVSTDLEICCFSPPISDFAVNLIKVVPNTSFSLKGIGSASILLVIEGEGKIGSLPVHKGTILFLSAEKGHSITATSTMCIYQAFSPV